MTRDSRGSVTPWAISGLAVLCLVALLIGRIGGAVVTGRSTQSAADLAALAGAAAIQHGRDGCTAAERSAHLNDVQLTDCEVEGEVVRVVVSRLAPRMFGRDLIVRGRARAGPS